MQGQKSAGVDRGKWSDIEEPPGLVPSLVRVLGRHPAGIGILGLLVAPNIWGIGPEQPYLLLADLVLIAIVAVAAVRTNNGTPKRFREIEGSSHTRDESEDSG